MASFDENGKYIKTNWKAGDKITATKLNKIEESIEAVNDNDISRHVEADARLDALEAKDVAHDKEFTNVKNIIADNKALAELGDYEIDSKMQLLEKELNDGIEEVNSIASTVDGKIAKAEADMTNAVNQGKADMEAMVAEAEADLEYIENEVFNIVTPLGNGADDTDNINEALAKNKGVLLTSGDFIINGTINTTHSGQIIQGQGKAITRLIFTKADASNCISIQHSECTVEKLTIRSQNINNHNCGIELANTTHTNIMNCRFENLGIGVSTAVESGTKWGNNIMNCSFYICFCGILLRSNSHSTNIKNNEIQAGTYGVVIGNLDNGEIDHLYSGISTNINIKDNIIEGNKQQDVYIANSTYKVAIHDNYFENTSNQPDKEYVIQVGCVNDNDSRVPTAVSIEGNYAYMQEEVVNPIFIKMDRASVCSVNNNSLHGKWAFFIDPSMSDIFTQVTVGENYTGGVKSKAAKLNTSTGLRGKIQGTSTAYHISNAENEVLCYIPYSKNSQINNITFCNRPVVFENGITLKNKPLISPVILITTENVVGFDNTATIYSNYNNAYSNIKVVKYEDYLEIFLQARIELGGATNFYIDLSAANFYSIVTGFDNRNKEILHQFKLKYDDGSFVDAYVLNYCAETVPTSVTGITNEDMAYRVVIAAGLNREKFNANYIILNTNFRLNIKSNNRQ